MSKKKIAFVFSLIVCFASFAHASEINKEGQGVRLPIAANPQYDVEIQLQPEIPKADETATGTVTVRNNTTGKEWEFSQKEFLLVIKSWENWEVVSKTDPEITKFEQDAENLYITFNYYTTTNDGRTKTSVLSGVIIMNKKYLTQKTGTTEMFIGLIVGLAGYAVLTTILVIILIIL